MPTTRIVLVIVMTTLALCIHGLYAVRFKHVVLLMEENRAFDHFLGKYPGANGLTGNEYNLLNTSDPNSKRIYVTPNASNVNQCDPDHSTPGTSWKLFGKKAFDEKNYTHPTMSGFVEEEAHLKGPAKTHDYCGVMNYFLPEDLPVMTSLADEYVLMDRFFASLPGPTWPNRLYFLSGTSAGLTETFPWYQDKTGHLYPQKTIFDQVTEGGGTWKVYYNDTPWELMLKTLAVNTDKLHPLDVFFDDAKKGTLPSLSWINPRCAINYTAKLGANDQHPDHDVNLGEAFYKDIYEALRASPAWLDTLFILTYDEHGGFYDHVPPPSGVPGQPDKSYPDHDFVFDRLGLRIPTLIISAYSPKGVIQGAPPAKQKPFANSEYDLTSVMATLRKVSPALMNATNLTARDGWSATFEHLFLSSPRHDCPMHLPDPLPPSRSFEEEAQLSINALQLDIATWHGHHAGTGKPPQDTKQEHLAQFLADSFAETRRRREGRSTLEDLELVIGPSYNITIVTTNLTINRNDAVPYCTISAIVSPSSTIVRKEEWCVTAGPTLAPGDSVSIERCRGSIDPAHNTNSRQHWLISPQQTFMAAQNRSLCVETPIVLSKDSTFWTTQHLSLQRCAPNKITQQFGIDGKVPGDEDNGQILFGPTQWLLRHRSR